jgi:hypothetical protein
MESTLGSEISAFALLDRDYRPEEECADIVKSCVEICKFVIIHECKEIENYILVPSAIDRAAALRLTDRARRGGEHQDYKPIALRILEEFAVSKRTYITGQLLAARRDYERKKGAAIHDATFNQEVLDDFENRWRNPMLQVQMLPGKDALSYINQILQQDYGINVTATGIIDAMRVSEVPGKLSGLLNTLKEFASSVA